MASYERQTNSQHWFEYSCSFLFDHEWNTVFANVNCLGNLDVFKDEFELILIQMICIGLAVLLVVSESLVEKVCLSLTLTQSLPSKVQIATHNEVLREVLLRMRGLVDIDSICANDVLANYDLLLYGEALHLGYGSCT